MKSGKGMKSASGSKGGYRASGQCKTVGGGTGKDGYKPHKAPKG